MRTREIEWLGSYFDEDLRQLFYIDFLGDVFTIKVFESDFYDTQWYGNYDAPIGQDLATFNVGNDVNQTCTVEVLGTARAEVTKPILSYSPKKWRCSISSVHIAGHLPHRRHSIVPQNGLRIR